MLYILHANKVHFKNLPQMKKVLFSLSMLALAATMTTFSSCDLKEKVKEAANIDYDFDFEGASAEFDLPIITELNATVYPDTTEIPLELAGKIEQYSEFVQMDDIQSVTVTSATMEILDGNTTNDMSNFETGLVLFSTDSKPEMQSIATNDAIPDAPATKIDLAVSSGINLLDYMKTGTKIYYTAGFNLRRATTKTLRCKVVVKYHVDFK
jgi:hypothetical protein